jgi:hypothetical protein
MNVVIAPTKGSDMMGLSKASSTASASVPAAIGASSPKNNVNSKADEPSDGQEDCERTRLSQPSPPYTHDHTISRQGGPSFQPLSITSSLQRYDILLGRGSGANEQHGNKIFRGLVKEYLKEFNACPSRQAKNIVVRKVMAAIKKNGGRFVKKLTSLERQQLGFVPDEGQGNTPVYATVLDEDIIMEKVRQNFRYLRERELPACTPRDDVPASISFRKKRRHNAKDKPSKKARKIDPDPGAHRVPNNFLQANLMLAGGINPALLFGEIVEKQAHAAAVAAAARNLLANESQRNELFQQALTKRVDSILQSILSPDAVTSFSLSPLLALLTQEQARLRNQRLSNLLSLLVDRTANGASVDALNASLVSPIQEPQGRRGIQSMRSVIPSVAGTTKSKPDKTPDCL